MALLYPPKVGDIVMCEFPACLQAPEMVKTRPVIVISPTFKGREKLVTVVPISNSEPCPILPHHCPIPVKYLPKFMQASGGDRWAKCDMVYTLCSSRLSLIARGKDRATGKRLYDKPRLDLPLIQAVRRGVASALGISAEILQKDEVIQELISESLLAIEVKLA